MEYQYIKLDVNNRIGVATVDFPPANSLAPKVRDELKTVVTSLTQRDDVWTIIITAAGQKFFMAGADIPSLKDLEPETGLARVRAAREFFNLLSGNPKPVLAAINGLCLGGGLELAMACDIRIAAEHVKLGLPEVGLGLMPGGGGTQRLPRLVSPGLARYLTFTGKILTAEQGREAGLVEKVVPAADLVLEARAMADLINSKGPLGVRAAKIAIKASSELPLEEGLDLENQLWAELCGTRDMKEGVSAFLEKRSPVFKAK